jgi:N-glycosylase/DNA lyase
MYNIESYNGISRITEIDKNELDINKTLDCGQAFRWNKIGDNQWLGVANEKLIWLCQGEFKDGKNGIATNLSIEDTNWLIYYFNLDINYTDEISKLNLDSFAKLVYENGKGIHILRQDIVETMITFLMTQFNSMHNARLIVNRLSENFGIKLETQVFGKKYTGYSFPTLEVLSTLTEKDFKQYGVGFRATYVYDLVQTLYNQNSLIDTIKQSDYNTSMQILKSFNGIGDKVANCVSLFALHHVEAFPIDLHIKRIINEEYNGHIDLSNYGNIAGIIQQYMYYYKAFN